MYVHPGCGSLHSLGFDFDNHKCVSAKDNLPSVATHPVVGQEYMYLERECEAGRVVGPLPQGSIPNLHISP